MKSAVFISSYCNIVAFEKDYCIFGATNHINMEQLKIYDVIIIGGSYAGLSAALALGRSRREVLVIDGASPCNRQTPYSHNFLTRDGVPPAELTRIGREQLASYPSVQWMNTIVIEVEKRAEIFLISTQNGTVIRARKLVLATGIIDELPPIEGLSTCWGISVVHCPYCHGYEFRDRPTAILANSERAFHLASLVRNLTDKITVCTNGDNSFSEEHKRQFQSHQIAVTDKKPKKLNHMNGTIHELVFEDDTALRIDAMYVAAPFRQSTDLAGKLGCALDEHGYIKVNPLQQTDVPGVFACGDNSSRMRSVANSVYTGSVAGAAVNAELASEWMKAG